MAFTILVAGRALTLIVLPKAVVVPAFLAGLIRVLSMQSPGRVNLPAFFTSDVASVTSSVINPETAFFSKPDLDANSAVMPLFDIDTAFAFMTFIAFTIAGKRCEVHCALQLAVL